MPKTLVIVESPAKAKTISRFLGEGYDVQASFGHIRDLPESSDEIPEAFKKQKWAKLGVNVENGFEPLYVVPGDKKRHVDNLKRSAKDAERVMLATDEDREGESISWHILEVLKPKKSVKVERIVFHEITPEAIEAAIKNPRQVDAALVRAQETRRILDRLYGYTLSPLLWRKVGPKLSAGRVQSVAVRLVVMRERERRDFVRVQYGGVTAKLEAQGGGFDCKLTRVSGANVADGQSFSPRGELAEKGAVWLKPEQTQPLAERLEQAGPWIVSKLEKKPGKEHPPAPFMTSTLQQEANRKLGFSARRTMQVAQNLYEGIDIGGGSVGLITYMRTDSLSLAERAVKEAREVIESKYGKEYVPRSPREYKSKAKNAQEAHEAVRPTDLGREPASIKRHLTEEQFKLYDLIWKRTLACQMNPAEVERTALEVEVKEGGDSYTFGASGKTILFPGFLRVYVEGSDDPEAELGDRETILPEVKTGQVLPCKHVRATEHETKPPARYTEASLVRKLEDEGVGRPSTYASIIGTIQDRGYISKKGNELVPSFTAFAVTSLLEDNFGELVDVRFTARMEDDLDEIAGGKGDMVTHLHAFYSGEKGLAKEVETRAADIPFPTVPVCEGVVVRIGRSGPFLQRGEGGPGNTANIPDDMPPADLTPEAAETLFGMRGAPQATTTDPNTGGEVAFKSGRFGAYLEQETANGPKRVTLPPGESESSLSPEDVGLLFTFPRNLGKTPEGDEVTLAVGRYGAYLSAGEKKANVGDWRSASTLTLEAAVEALSRPFGRAAKSAPDPLKTLGKHADLEGEVRLMSGRFGPYVTDGTTNATVPRGTDPENLTLDQAVEMLKAKAAAGPAPKRGRFPKRGAAAKKSPAKKSTRKK